MKFKHPLWPHFWKSNLGISLYCGNLLKFLLHFLNLVSFKFYKTFEKDFLINYIWRAFSFVLLDNFLGNWSPFGLRTTKRQWSFCVDYWSVILCHTFFLHFSFILRKTIGKFFTFSAPVFLKIWVISLFFIASWASKNFSSYLPLIICTC